MAIKNVLFDLGDTLWHFPKMPSTDHIRMETVRRVGETVKSWGVPFEGELRFLGRDIRLGVEKVDRAAYESDCVSPDFNEAVRQIAAEKGLHLDYEQAARLWTPGTSAASRSAARCSTTRFRRSTGCATAASASAA